MPDHRLMPGLTNKTPLLLSGLGKELYTSDTLTGKLIVWPANAL